MILATSDILLLLPPGRNAFRHSVSSLGLRRWTIKLKGVSIVFSYIWPILLIVTANTVYQICAKGIPQAMNTYASMTVTYAVASVFSFVMFLVTSKGHPSFKDFALTNWATIILGIVITGLEVGFICAYKAGWKVNTLALVANTLLAAVLIFVGFFLYKEQLSISKIAGIVICLAGLYFINK